jgi:hypothetical protein
MKHTAILSHFLTFITGSSSRLLRIRISAAVTLYWFPVRHFWCKEFNPSESTYCLPTIPLQFGIFPKMIKKLNNLLLDKANFYWTLTHVWQTLGMTGRLLHMYLKIRKKEWCELLKSYVCSNQGKYKYQKLIAIHL